MKILFELYGSIFITHSLFILFFYICNYILRRNKIIKQESLERLNIGILLVLISLVTNIIYTSYLGWNETPETTLELILDILNAIQLIYAFYVCYQSFTKFNIKGEKSNDKFKSNS